MASDRPDPRDVEAREIREKIAALTLEADLVDITLAGAEEPLWRRILEPLLVKEKAAFGDAALDLDLADDKGKRNAIALQARSAFARDLLDIVGRKLEPGFRDECLKEATRLNGILERNGK